MCALFATMQGDGAFRAFSLPIDVRGQGCGAIEAARRNDVLQKAGEAGASYVNRRAGTGGFGTVLKWAVPRPITVAVAIHVAPLSILTVVIHVENRLLDLALSQLYRSRYSAQVHCWLSLRINAEDSCGNRLKLERRCPARA